MQRDGAAPTSTAVPSRGPAVTAGAAPAPGHGASREQAPGHGALQRLAPPAGHVPSPALEVEPVPQPGQEPLCHRDLPAGSRAAPATSPPTTAIAGGQGPCSPLPLRGSRDGPSALLPGTPAGQGGPSARACHHCCHQRPEQQLPSPSEMGAMPWAHAVARGRGAGLVLPVGARADAQGRENEAVSGSGFLQQRRVRWGCGAALHLLQPAEGTPAAAESRSGAVWCTEDTR